MSLLERLFAVAEPPRADPIDHPAIRAMTLRELADLPLPRPEPTLPGGELAPGRSASRQPVR